MPIDEDILLPDGWARLSPGSRTMPYSLCKADCIERYKGVASPVRSSIL